MTTTEEMITEIFETVDELRVLLKLEEDTTEVKVEKWHSQWHVTVRPSLMNFGGKFTVMMQRGHNDKTLDGALTKALEGAREELKLFKDGKTLAV